MARVLLVDDEADIRDLVGLGLTRAGHDVLVAGDGEQGLRIAAEEQPDVIVLDVIMPGLEGWDVLAQLKSCPFPTVSEIPVIMLTTESSASARIRGGIEGAVGYVTKPFRVSELRQAVTDVLIGAPEPVLRRQAQEQAMRLLSDIETTIAARTPTGPVPAPAGRGGPAQAPDTPPAPPSPEIGAEAVARLSRRQREVLVAVATAATVTEAAERLGLSRTSVYANLHRAARRLGGRSARELLTLARAGAIELGEPGGGC